MKKLMMHSQWLVDENIRQIGEMFPNTLTERKNEKGETELVIDFDVLKQELSKVIVEGHEERYQFTWPDKKKSILLANAPISDTLRPCREESVDFDTTDNLYIEGDNLNVLKLLQETYLGKVKTIYIDPPYNTGNDFLYEDDFSQDTVEYLSISGQYDVEGNRLVRNLDSNGRFHTDWLNMIYPRLKLARDFLSVDGVIFISIDDNEIDNLMKLCNEVFGEENYIGLLTVENNPKGRKNSDFISVTNEYLLIYSKNKSNCCFVENIPKNARELKQDIDGSFVHNSGKRVLVGENSFNRFVTNEDSEKHYSVYYNPGSSDIRLVKESELHNANAQLFRDGYQRYISFYEGKFVENTYTKTKFQELFDLGLLDIKGNKIYEKNKSTTIRMKSVLLNQNYEAIINGQITKYKIDLLTTSAGSQLKELMGGDYFNNSKNINYIILLLSLLESKDDTVLDFFSGSATTAHAVMQLNAEDGGKRKFIMVQLPEPTDEKSEAFKAGYKNICEIGKERIRRAGAKIKEEIEQANRQVRLDEEPKEVPDIGFRVLKLDSSNMKDVYYTPEEFTQLDLSTLADNIKEDRTPEDILFQVMLELGVLLSSPIEASTIAGKKVFRVADNFLIACFDKDITNETVTAIAKLKPYYAVFRDSGYANDAVAVNFEQLFAAYSPDTVRRVL